MVLVIEIIIWIIAIVYAVITFYMINKSKKEHNEALKKEVDAMAEASKASELPKNDFGQTKEEQRDETIENLIELSDNSVAVTLSSLIRTLYNEPSYSLENIEKGNYSYGGYLNSVYKTLTIAYMDINRNYYDIYIMDSNYPCTQKKAKLDDQVLIIRIEKRNDYY